MLKIPANVIASCFAIISFVAALIVGMAADNPASVILWRGLVVMGVCWFIGRAVGVVAFQTIDIQVKKLKEANPIPLDLSQQHAQTHREHEEQEDFSDVEIVDEDQLDFEGDKEGSDAIAA